MNVDVIAGKNMFLGEIREQGATIRRNDGQDIVLSSPTYQRFKADGTEVDTTPQEASVILDSSEAFIYALIPAGAEAGSFFVIFSYQVEGQTAKVKVTYSVFEYRQ